MGLKRTTIHGLVLWLTALLLIVGGIYLSNQRFLDQEWLSRAGCLIVVLGIWSGVGVLIEERLLLNSLLFRRRLALVAARRRFKPQQQEYAQRVEEVKKTYDEQIDRFRHELHLSFGVLEASLLLTGTTLWGFGDLIKYVL